MKNIYKIRMFVWLCLLITSGFIASCEEEENEPHNGEVTLLSFGPGGVKHGEKISVIGYNLDKVASVEIPNATIAKDQFLTRTSDLIEFEIPLTATAGKLLLKTDDGKEIVSKTILNFDVPVEITTVTPEARPGAAVTITGKFLNWVESIQFGTREMPIVDFESQSANELVFTVPLDAVTGTLILNTGGANPLAIETEDLVVVTLPKVAAISPLSVKHGENITLTGTDLDLVGEVQFAGVGEANVSDFVSQTPTELVVKVPDNAIDGTLTLVTAFSSVEVELQETQSINIILPAITTLSPNPVDDGAELTIEGTNLDLVKAITFSPNITTSDLISQSATEIVVNVPAGAVKGSLTFTTFQDFKVETNILLDFNSAPEAPALDYFFFEDNRNSEWDDWSYGGAVNWESTSPVFAGSNAVKKTFDGSWDVLRLHAGNGIDVSGYTELVFYVYGEETYNGEDLYVLVNEGWDTGYTFTAVAGEWKEVVIKIADINGGTATQTWNDFMLRSGMTGTVSFDHIGLR